VRDSKVRVSRFSTGGNISFLARVYLYATDRLAVWKMIWFDLIWFDFD
jgi:hypothetical protein